MDQTALDQPLTHPAGRRDSLKAFAAAGSALLATAVLHSDGTAKKRKKKRKKGSGSGATAPVAVVRTGNNAEGEGDTSSFAQCEEGEQAISGGFDMLPGSSALYSRPVPNGVGATPTGWEVSVNGPAHVAVQAYVICLQTQAAENGSSAGRRSRSSRKHARKNR
jgi:hypothetical protein